MVDCGAECRRRNVDDPACDGCGALRGDKPSLEMTDLRGLIPPWPVFGIGDGVGFRP